MDDFVVWDWAVRISIVGLFAIALGCVLYLLSHVVVPVILAWVMATVFLPLLNHATRLGLPRTAAAILVVVLMLACITLVIGIFSVPASYWLVRADELGELIRQKMELFRQPLDMLEQVHRALTQGTADTGTAVYIGAQDSSLVSSIFGTLTPVIDEAMIFVIALAFNLLYQNEIQSGLVGFIRDPDARRVARETLREIERNMSAYFGTVTIINICLGIAATGIAWLVGFPQPFMWGLLAAVLNYVPYVGPFLVMATFLVVGIVVFDTTTHALIAPGSFLALTILEGQVITPTLVGHRLTINPFLVFVSIAFWTWMWGPIGAFLAVPVLLSVMVAARHISSSAAAPNPDLQSQRIST